MIWLKVNFIFKSIAEDETELTEKTNIIVHDDNSIKASGLCETRVNFCSGNNYIFFQTCMQPTSNTEHFPPFFLSLIFPLFCRNPVSKSLVV